MDLMTWLAQATPDDWHQVAWGWNWDSGHETLQWIIRQPTCDCGTALLVYWKGGPRYYAQYTTRAEVPEYEIAGYDLVIDIERAYLAGAYTRQEIAFDPHNDEGQDWAAEYSTTPNRRPIPALMYIASPGRHVERDDEYDDGYPLAVDVDE